MSAFTTTSSDETDDNFLRLVMSLDETELDELLNVIWEEWCETKIKAASICGGGSTNFETVRCHNPQILLAAKCTQTTFCLQLIMIRL